MRGQNKKYLSLYLYKGKIGHLYAQENKKRPTHPRTTKRGMQSASQSVRIVHVCIGLRFLCMYVFIPRPRGCYILTQKYLFVKKFLHVFSLSTVDQKMRRSDYVSKSL